MRSTATVLLDCKAALRVNVPPDCALMQIIVVLTQRYMYLMFMVEQIHNRIALFRAEAAMSRKTLADAVGVHAQTIGYLERGDYKPSLELAMRLAQTFDVPVGLLFSFAPFPSVAQALRQLGEN